MTPELEVFASILGHETTEPISYVTVSSLQDKPIDFDRMLADIERFREEAKRIEEEFRTAVRDYIQHFRIPLEDLAWEIGVHRDTLYCILYLGARISDQIYQSCRVYFERVAKGHQPVTTTEDKS